MDTFIKLRYAAYIAYQLRAFFPQDRIDEYDNIFNNYAMMNKIALIADKHHFAMKDYLYDVEMFYEDGYDDAVKLFDKFVKEESE